MEPDFSSPGEFHLLKQIDLIYAEHLSLKDSFLPGGVAAVYFIQTVENLAFQFLFSRMCFSLSGSQQFAFAPSTDYKHPQIVMSLLLNPQLLEKSCL